MPVGESIVRIDLFSLGCDTSNFVNLLVYQFVRMRVSCTCIESYCQHALSVIFYVDFAGVSCNERGPV